MDCELWYNELSMIPISANYFMRRGGRTVSRRSLVRPTQDIGPQPLVGITESVTERTHAVSSEKKIAKTDVDSVRC